MKFRNSLVAGLVTLAGFVASSPAQTAITANLSDLILGFRATGGTGSGSNLEVNLGSAGNFVTQTPGTTVVLSQLNVGDLTATFGGSSWNTRTDLLFAVVGAVGRGGNTGPNSQVASTLWATSAAATPFGSTPWTTKVSSLQNNASVKIESLYSGSAGSLNGQNSTANSNFSFVTATSTVGSWSNLEGSTASGFAFFNPVSQLEQNTNTGGGSVYSDLYQLQPSTGTAVMLGSFALSSSGVLSFTAGTSAIPEPSTYAAIFGAAAMGVALLRRRRMAAVTKA